MPDQTNQFRAALHGYNREDVVAFIDRMSRDHEDIVRRLEEKNERLRAELAQANEALEAAGYKTDLENALAEAQAAVAELQARNGELEAQIHGLEDELEEARARAEEKAVPVPVTQDLNEPIPPVAEVLPVTVAPSKDYTELELAAYRRAELTERLARERSGDIYRQVQSVFAQANERLNTGRSDLENLSRTLTGNINEMLTLLASLISANAQTEASFSEIGARNREFVEDKPE